MPSTSRALRLGWIPLLICALGVRLWIDGGRIRHIDHVSSLGASETTLDAGSPTGYFGGRRSLIAPEHYNDTYRWIVGTQAIIEHGGWRVRHTDFDNPPAGREVRKSSVFRWWILLVAWGDHVVSGRPIGLAAERAALHAPVALHLCLLAGCTLLVARWFGGAIASLFVVVEFLLFPWTGGFLPGILSHHEMATACVMISLLCLVSAVADSAGRREKPGLEKAVDAERHLRWRMALAGIAGGLGLWVEARDVAPVLAGVGLGAAVAPWLGRRAADGGDKPDAFWRIWSLSGSLTSLAGYLVEYFPAHMDMRLDANQPLYALAWIGAGELIVFSQKVARAGWPGFHWRAIALPTLALAAIAAVPLAVAWSATAWWDTDLFARRLTLLPGSPLAGDLKEWLLRDGLNATAWATCLPVAVLAIAGWRLLVPGLDRGLRTALTISTAGSVAALTFACLQLRWWAALDATLLVLLPLLVLALARSRGTPWRKVSIPALMLILAATGARSVSVHQTPRDDGLTVAEAEGLIERDLGHRLTNARGSQGVVVLAPPFRTAALGFYGGFRGIGSMDPENEQGLFMAVRISRETSAEVVKSLIRQTGMTHIILPDWDRTLHQLAHIDNVEGTTPFLGELDRWRLPRWLKPVAYQPPLLEGLPGRAVTIFEVVDEQIPVVAVSRIVEYFVDMDQLEKAEAAAGNLRQFSSNLGAMVALSHLAAAQRDGAKLETLMQTIRVIIDNGYDRNLLWDRRVSLASVLAQTGHENLARDQIGRCMALVDAPRLRSLSINSLYYLNFLSRAYRIPFPSDSLQDLALLLLPPEPRQRIESMLITSGPIPIHGTRSPSVLISVRIVQVCDDLVAQPARHLRFYPAARTEGAALRRDLVHPFAIRSRRKAAPTVPNSKRHLRSSLCASSFCHLWLRRQPRCDT